MIYYPKRKLDIVKSTETDLEDWYTITINHLILVARTVSAKYTRSKVSKALSQDFKYIIQELLHESTLETKFDYVNKIIETIIETGRADQFIEAMCCLIQRLVIDSLHIIGDVYDRGPGAHLIMDLLCDYHNFDIQWGNHDILWMGAAAGSDSCIANVIRMAMRYGNLATLEDGYGINLLPLATFAMDTYGDDPCTLFMPKIDADDKTHNERTLKLIAQMHQAISVIQFKLEAEVITRRPEFNMEDRKVLERVDFCRGTFLEGGVAYELLDKNFPTVDPNCPNKLTEEERELVSKLHRSFVLSEKLRRHIECFYTHGSMYLVINSNLLYHASVPMNADGTLKEVTIRGKCYKGRALLDRVDNLARLAYNDDANSSDRQYAMDFLWYLWCGKESPLFDKARMATFERYFLREKELHAEEKGAYYALRDSEAMCDMLLDEFGVEGEHRHIISGHVPVKTTKGENPIKANGKLIVIDGGFSKAYQKETGIAGYTLVYHSRALRLVQHEPFTSSQDAVLYGNDIISTSELVELSSKRVMVRNTDRGREMVQKVRDLRNLLTAYRKGIIKEK